MCTALERLKDEGYQERDRDLVLKWTKKGYSAEAIADLLDRSVEFVRKIQEESEVLV